MKKFALLAALLPGAVDARSMECLDTVNYWLTPGFIVEENTPGQVVITPQDYGDGRPAGFALIILHSETTDNSVSGDRYSTILTSLFDNPEQRYVPTSWLVDWEEVALASTSFGTDRWSVSHDYDCRLITGGS